MTTDVLRVRLGDLDVGSLTRADPNDRIEFRFLERYRDLSPRPIFGQWFVGRESSAVVSRVRLPHYFSNLLPEGMLRALVADDADVRPAREFFLLERLGRDLPGAVVVERDDEALSRDEEREVVELDASVPQSPFKFSLAGLQLKFSALRAARRMTIPASGAGGDWIVKLPDQKAPRVPENEWSIMSLAHSVGIDVPEFDLVKVAEIDGLPEGIGFSEPLAFAIRRFDRQADGSRVHMEDFAQILGLYPEQKYAKHNYETIASIVRHTAGDQALNEFVRRLVFIVAIANGDAHHKNWTLIYTDGRTASLSPAYDLISTIPYIPSDRLGLNLAKSKRYEDVALGSFTRLARKIDADPAAMEALVRDTVETVRDAWSTHRDQLRLDPTWVAAIEAHMKRVPLLSM